MRLLGRRSVKRSQWRVGCCLVLVVVLGGASRVFGQEAAPAASAGAVSLSTYRSILDRVFPRPEPDFREVDYQVVLRFEPSFDRESQIIINARKDRTYDIVEYRLDSREGIWDQLGALRERARREDPAAMSQFVHVTPRTIRLSIRYCAKL